MKTKNALLTSFAFATLCAVVSAHAAAGDCYI